MKSVISSTVLACLRAQGLTVVRQSDTQYGSDETDRAFAEDVANNAAMVLSDQDDEVRVSTWSPAHQERQ